MSKRHPALFEVGIGLILTGFFAYSYLKGGTSVDTVSQKTYDLFAHLAGPAPTTDSVRIVGIDQASVESLGRWPWPRGLTGQLIDEIAADGAKVIGLNVFLVDPDRNEALEELGHLEERYKQILDQEKPALARKRIDTAAFEDFLNTDLANAKDGLNGDAALARSIEQAVNVVLPMYFVPGEALGKVPDLPEFFAKEKVALPSDASVPEAQGASLPLDSFANAALAIGHANLYPDSDGTLRRIPLLVRYGTNAFPSFALQIVREYLSLQRNALKFEPPATFQLNKARIPVDESGMAFVRFAGGAGTVKSFSALSVLDGSLPEKSLDGKIVLVGLTAPGAADGTVMVAPGGERITGLEILANHIENILTQTFISRPAWAGKAELGLLGAAALVVILILPFLRARFAVPIAALVFAGIAGSSWFLFVKRGMWVSPAHGASLLLAGFVVLIAKRLIFTEKGKEMVEAEGVETNKMLGLSFQGQGMLDLAFEKFRRIPLDAATKDLLYNLGLDMERKRMFAKAAAVYEHIATVDAKFKDIREKIEFLKKAGEGAVFGGIGKKGQDATVMVEGLGQSTTLGRYEVVKELGRGAMGIVYLGRDPKINRQVAIKTLRFEEAVDEEQVKAVKERFFREAESAGNLTHPNIIRIFDAGEDQDVAYIAMELIEGHDLKKYCEKTALLPIPRVLDIVAQVANGLEYAHAQGVVHRDIKPGNIMMIKDGTLRITDFGIARIQASSKTATGAVLGTPAYMSPEQVRGQKVDGRADIFSLGVTLFELLTGEKPFQADS
ncbi:MAG TPA: serine/threonine-protein kinase, partial [Candidatus Baltobacteraceae bacterium]|nr:serine/threonine-protein kinase [Candidatus Baltobacteraceae bacterium]